MPENQIPATQPESGAAPAEFNFANPPKESPRIRRRSLKTKPAGLVKPTGSTLPAARELEREAPPLSAAQTQPAQPPAREIAAPKTEPAARAAEVPSAPPRTTPTPAVSRPASSAAPAQTASRPATVSPHGTRPATLYYSSYPRNKDKEAPSPMKTIPPPANPASSSSSTPLPASMPRPTTPSARASGVVDYRTNVERQSREQKSVGNILAYAVYALIGFFVLSAGLAIYGADVIFKQLHDQSVTVSDLDQRYAASTKDLNTKLATTQDTLTQAQAQIARQQDLILRQQEELNRLIAATNDNVNALKAEKQARAQETASLRGRVKDLENRGTYQQKY